MAESTIDRLICEAIYAAEAVVDSYNRGPRKISTQAMIALRETVAEFRARVPKVVDDA